MLAGTLAAKQKWKATATCSKVAKVLRPTVVSRPNRRISRTVASLQQSHLSNSRIYPTVVSLHSRISSTVAFASLSYRCNMRISLTGAATQQSHLFSSCVGLPLFVILQAYQSHLSAVASPNSRSFK